MGGQRPDLIREELPWLAREAKRSGWGRGVVPPIAAMFPSAKVHATGAQSVASDTPVKITMNATDWDNDEMFDNTNDRLIAKHAGLLLVVAGLAWAANSAGERYLYVYQNGAAVASQIIFLTASAVARATISVPVSVARNDYVELFGFHSVGVNLNTAVADGLPFLSATWIGVPS